MDNSLPKVYVAYEKNVESRLRSTSGGVCHLMSQYVINQGGIVSGIVFDKNYDICRKTMYNSDDIEMLRGSKYVEANQYDSYLTIQRILEKGDFVLFIGTPCQVAGLLSFLGERPDNLICIDFICLGVPSADVWKAYREEVSNGKKINEITYKDKRSGWKSFTFCMKFSDGTEIAEPGRENRYMKYMIDKLFSRPSCYQCRYRTIDRLADITVADAWGMDKLAPEMIDNQGTSSVVIRTEAGESFFNNIKNDLKYKKIDICEFTKAIPKAWIQPVRSDNRDLFFKAFVRGMSYLDAIRIIEESE